MSTPTSGDLLLVNRGGVNYQIDYDDMSTLQDTDLLLVNRAGVNYQIAASDLDLGPDGLILPSVDVLTPVNGAGLNEGDPYTPLSSAYVSTDTTPITYHYFPELITTVSGGSWVNENNLFDGNSSNYAELTGAAYAVSQVVFTPHASWSDGDTTVWAYGEAGGVIEILDNTDTVLRTYPISTNNGNTSGTNRYEVGIVRTDQKIRFTTNGQNESLYISRINLAPTDYVITGRVAFEFTDDTDLDKMVAPIIMTDENGDVKVPTTSTVDSTTTISGQNKSIFAKRVGNGSNFTFSTSTGSNPGMAPKGQRMTWTKADKGYPGAISDNVAIPGQYLLTSTTTPAYSPGPTLDENTESTYIPSNNWNADGYDNYIAEIGVAPGVLDIIQYTGDGIGLREIQHNLGCKPGMIIIKRTDVNGYKWQVWHKDNTANLSLWLNTDDYAVSANYFPSEPTQEAFYINGSDDINNYGGEFVAYVFAAETPGKVYCGKYTGNGAWNGQNINIWGAPACGFLLIKRIDARGHWVVTTKQAQENQRYWNADTSTTMQGSSSSYVGFLGSNGFFVLGQDADFNASNGEYIYLYIDNALTGPNSTQLNLLGNQDLEYFTDGTQITSNLAASGSRISYGSERFAGNNDVLLAINPTVGGQTFMDIRPQTGNKWLIWAKCFTDNNAKKHNLFDSERHPLSYLVTNNSNAEVYNSQGIMEPNGQSGYIVGDRGELNNSNESFIYFNFLGAPEFFDVQKYVGTGAAGNKILHDIGTRVGCVLFKDISHSDHWYVYHSSLTEGTVLSLNQNIAASWLFPGWLINGTDGFTLNATNTEINAAGRDYISYIFAEDTPYVKCGQHTGSGAGTQVNVGFRPRWMMIKRKDSSGMWAIFDKNMDNNTYLLANDAVKQGGFNWSFNATGIELTGSWPDVNGPGGEFIYIAIADDAAGHPPNFVSSSTVQGTPDVNAATMVVNAESFDVGDSASAPALEASITAVGGSNGNTLLVDSSTGTWMPGLYAKGSETTVSAPSADEVTFTSTNAGTTAFSGVDATLSSRTWTLESGPSATGPWTVVDTYVDYDALNSQDGATPWSTNKPALAADTFYRVKVQYNSTNAESVESVYSTFKTSA